MDIGIGIYMGLDGHRARQRWVGLGTVHIFLNPAAKILTQDVGICPLCKFLNPLAYTYLRDVGI